VHRVSTRRVDDLVRALVYLKVHRGPLVVSKAVVVATGARADGHREVLGQAVGDREDGAFWTAFMHRRRARSVA
jgi:putative transposase